MYDRSNNEITFPHIIPTPVLDGINHSWRDVDGGAITLAELKINQNKFFGGNVDRLGWIKKYGMYACKRTDDKNQQTIVGFYIHDASKLTKLGREMCKKAFPTATIKFVAYDEPTVTPEEIKEYKALQKKYIDKGMSPELVKSASAEELAELERAIASGKAEKSSGTVAPTETKTAKELPPSMRN
jgi:hypothetical protein